MIKKVEVYCDKIAKLNVELKASDVIKIKKQDLDLFNSSLKLPSGAAISRHIQLPASFRQQFQDNPQDIFEIITTDNKFIGNACVDNQVVYIQNSSETVKVDLDSIQKIINVTQREQVSFKVKEAASIEFCTGIHISLESEISLKLITSLILLNDSGFAIQGSIGIQNFPFMNGITVISDFGFASYGLFSEQQVFDLAQKYMMENFEENNKIYMRRQGNIIALVVDEANLDSLMKLKQKSPSFKIEAGSGELLRVRAHEIDCEVSQISNVAYWRNQSSIFAADVILLNEDLYPTLVRDKFVSGLAGECLIVSSKTSDAKITIQTKQQMNGQIQENEAAINMREQHTFSAECTLIKLLKPGEVLESTNADVAKQQNSSLCFVKVTPQSTVTSSYQQTVSLAQFGPAVAFLEQARNQSISIPPETAEKIQQMAPEFVRSLSSELLRDLFRQLDISAPTGLKNELIARYVVTKQLEQTLIHFQKLLLNQNQLQSSVQITQQLIAQQREAAERHIAALKALQTNIVILKTTKVQEQFQKDLREGEVKIQMLEKRLQGLQGRLKLVTDEVRDAEDALRQVL